MGVEYWQRAQPGRGAVEMRARTAWGQCPAEEPELQRQPPHPQVGLLPENRFRGLVVW